MNKLTKTQTVTAIVVIILLVAAGIFYFFKNGSLSNWKTYTNPDYGFTFKYPVTVFPTKDASEVNDADKTGFQLEGSAGKLAILAFKTPFDPNSDMYAKSGLQPLGQIKIGDRTGYRYDSATATCQTQIDIVGVGSTTLSVAFASCGGDKDPVFSDQTIQNEILQSFTFQK